jgi:hypothetical protein
MLRFKRKNAAIQAIVDNDHDRGCRGRHGSAIEVEELDWPFVWQRPRQDDVLTIGGWPKAMHSLKRAVATAVIAFAASVVGMLLQRVVPEPILSEAKGPVGAMLGLFTLLLALVLGLLIWTAFSVYTTQQTEALSLIPMVAELDRAMSEYGPEGTAGRPGMIVALERARVRFFGTRALGPQAFTFEETWETMAEMDRFFDSLQPTTDRQKHLLQSARIFAKQFADTQVLMARQLHNPLPPFLLVIVVLWASAIFLGNGLIAKQNPIAVGAHLIGALGVGSAIFLILELISPYTGAVRLPSKALDRLLESLRRSGTGEGSPGRSNGAQTTIDSDEIQRPHRCK